MGITHKILRDQGLVVSRWVGSICDEDMLSSYRELYDGPEWQPGLSELVDVRRGDLTMVSAEGVRRLKDYAQSRVMNAPPFRTAVIADQALPFGLARMYELLNDGSPEEVSVFLNATKAIAWLEAPPDCLDEE